MQLTGDSQDELRWIAEDLQVPFLIVCLAENRQTAMLCDPDLDDMIAGIEWLRAHNVPLDLLRHIEPRDAKWRADLASTDEAAGEKEAREKSVYGHRMPRDRRGVDRLADMAPAVAEQLQSSDHQRADVTTSDHESVNNPVAAPA